MSGGRDGDAGSASIEELLRHEEEVPAPARRRSGIGWWVRTALSATALTAVTIVGLRLFGLVVPVAVVLAGYLAVLAIRRVTAQVAPPPPVSVRRRRDAGERGGTPYAGDEDALRVAVNRWETKLVWARGESDRFARGVLPPLGEMVDERLRQRHGLTRESDPARARALLGEPLWSLLTVPARHAPTPPECATLVAELEKL